MASKEPSFEEQLTKLQAIVNQLEQGLFGWNVTDCKICFEYGIYLIWLLRYRYNLAISAI